MKRKSLTVIETKSGVEENEMIKSELTDGKILTDIKGNQWKLGRVIGTGGFGEIYLASDDISKSVTNNAEYVIKVEPFSSGPLFVELHFYANAGKKELVEKWMEDRNLKTFGMPYYLGNGSYYHKNRRYRFIVLPRYGTDIETVFLNHEKKFSLRTTFTLASLIIDVLEYIHGRGYVHADIKAANLVLDRENMNKVYLIDYGLATKIYNDEGKHRNLEADQRKAHDGTLEYTSRDAHIGAHSRRSDLEVLGYNIIKWITGRLPWEGCSKEDQMQTIKKQMMSNIVNFMKVCFESESCDVKPPGALITYLDYINTLKFKDEPDYNYCRSLFRSAVQDAGYTYDGNISLNNRCTLPRKRKHGNIGKENDSNNCKKLCVEHIDEKPCALKMFNVRLTRKSTPTPIKFDWPAILSGNPEKLNSSISIYGTPEISSFMDEEVELRSMSSPDMRGLDNPTPAMKELMMKRRMKLNATNTSNFNSPIGQVGNTTPVAVRKGCIRNIKNRRSRHQRNHSSPLQKSTRCRKTLPQQKTFLSCRNEQIRYSSPLRIPAEHKTALQQKQRFRRENERLQDSSSPLPNSTKLKKIPISPKRLSHDNGRLQDSSSPLPNSTKLKKIPISPKRLSHDNGRLQDSSTPLQNSTKLKKIPISPKRLSHDNGRLEVSSYPLEKSTKSKKIALKQKHLRVCSNIGLRSGDRKLRKTFCSSMKLPLNTNTSLKKGFRLSHTNNWNNT